ncbi:MAG: GNAT family N-acetyltransferase [Acidobacteria bacterium]|nr:GNAT family N-acetyltransferase [Acidobacteriota bacterium]
MFIHSSTDDTILRMLITVQPCGLESILGLRDMYRLEMSCQIIHDSIHSRPGWTREYSLQIDGIQVGYGSLAIAGPWSQTPALYEVFVAEPYRLKIFELFRALRKACDATRMELQSNDVQTSVMFHTYAVNVEAESVLFKDEVRTSLAPTGATFRTATEADGLDVSGQQLPWHGVVEVDGVVAATGGILFHYNPPYGDIYMDVREEFQRRGLGSFIVQELKRVCYVGGFKPGARCSPKNIASQRTLQRAGFVPYGNLLVGDLPPIE